MHRVNINTDCNTLLLSACYLWKSTRVHGVSVADSPVVLQQSLWEDDRGGRAAQKQEVVYVHFSVWLCVCARTCECPCVRGRLRVWEREGRFFFM